MKKIITAFLVGLVSINGYAQSGTNSPYSQFAYGVLSEQSAGFNRGMNGVGLGFQEHNQVNFLNPASYASLDSLNFVFDMGASGQLTKFKEQSNTFSARNANFEYVVAGLRLAKNLGVSFGFLPFTNVGYNYSTSSIVARSESGTNLASTINYNGEGGIKQAYIGAGWKPFKNFSIGTNLSYIWGSYNKTVQNVYNDLSINTLSKKYTADFVAFHANIGAQYRFVVSPKNAITLGATYSFAHKLGAEPISQIISRNTQTGVSDTTTYRLHEQLRMPSTIGVGLMWNHQNKWKVGLDYSLQQWKDVKMPVFIREQGTHSYVFTNNQFEDRQKITLGGEFIPNLESRSFFSRVRYRLGISYTTPYLIINNQTGPKEYSASIGVGVPIINTYNNRSFLNVSVQWSNLSTQTLIKENTFRINIGLTFNERWFAKWKVE